MICSKSGSSLDKKDAVSPPVENIEEPTNSNSHPDNSHPDNSHHDNSHHDNQGKEEEQVSVVLFPP